MASGDLSSVAAAYAQHTSEFSTAINGMNQLSAALAPSSGASATALTNLSKTVAILAQQSSQFGAQDRVEVVRGLAQPVVDVELAQGERPLAGPPPGELDRD